MLKVNELIILLKTLDQNAEIDMADSEDQYSIGEIDKTISEGITINGTHSYTLIPINVAPIGERY